jgi:pSer/pThr/pTyr-binding forkhead associated (FHA) protein
VTRPAVDPQRVRSFNTMPDAHELQPGLEAERAGAPFFIYNDGAGAERIFVLRDASRLTIGRDAANDIALEWDAKASRLHAELVRMGSEWTIVDDGLSRNGTYVNGRRLTGRRRLRDGDTIGFGQTTAVFRAPVAAALEETHRAPGGGAAPDLTPAQRRVLVALCRPWRGRQEHAMPATNKEIADELVVSVDAVKANLRALFDKFGVEELPQNRKRARLVELAFETGAVSTRDL